MNTKFLVTTAMVLAGLSGAAWAQQTTPTGKPGQAAEGINQELMLGETATEQPLTGEDADTADTAGTDDAAEPATDTSGTADTTTPATGMATATVDERKGEVILDISGAEIDAMAEYQRDDEGWFTG